MAASEACSMSINGGSAWKRNDLADLVDHLVETYGSLDTALARLDPTEELTTGSLENFFKSLSFEATDLERVFNVLFDADWGNSITVSDLFVHLRHQAEQLDESRNREREQQSVQDVVFKTLTKPSTSIDPTKLITQIPQFRTMYASYSL